MNLKEAASIAVVICLSVQACKGDDLNGRIAFVTGVVDGLNVTDIRTDRIRPIAVTSLPVAGLPSGVEFSSFIQTSSGDDLNAPAVNNVGQTVFFAELTGPDVDQNNDGSLWIEGNGSLQLLAREGQLAPGASAGRTFASIRGDFPTIGDDGTVVFGVLLRNENQQFVDGTWISKNGSLELLALENEALPADPSFHIDAIINNYRVNNVGQVATWLRGTPTTSGNSQDGLYLFDGNGAVNPIAVTGDAAAGTGANYRSLGQRSFSLNDLGQVSYIGTVEASGVDLRRDAGIWLADSTGQTLLVREGDTAPGVLAGSTFRNTPSPFLSPPTLNQDGDVTFRASLGSLTNGVWTSNDGMLSRRLLEFDDQLPGEPGVGVGPIEFGSSKPPVSMNESGDIAYIASLFGLVTLENNLAILRDGGNGLEVVARTGELAPGTPSGSVFSSFSELPSGLALNKQGQLAFLGTYQDPITFESGNGIWAEDVSGNLQLIVRTGDVFEVAAGVERTVESLSFLPGSGNADGQRSGFDNLGRLAFHSNFTDGSKGIFVSSFVAVPEPSSSIAFPLIAFVLACFRRRT